MAAPFDTTTTLQTVLKVAQEQYFNKPLESMFVSGDVTNQLVEPAKQSVTGDGMTMQAITGIGDSVRISRDPYSEFSSGVPFDPQTYKVRWNERDPANHDFTNIKCSPRIGEYDLRRAADPATIVSIVDRLVKDNTADVAWTMALLRRIGTNAQMGIVNGTPKANDNNFMGNCSAYTSSVGATTARVNVKTCSPVWFRRNKFVDVYSSAGVLRWTNLKITNMNPADQFATNANSVCSIGLQYVTGTSTGTANLDALATGDIIYYAGAKNKGAISIEAWMTQPSSSGDSFFTRNRASTDYQWMLPTITRGDLSTSVKISRVHLNDAANARGFVNDDVDTGIVACANPLLVDSLRSQFEEAAFITWGPEDTRNKRYGNLGMIGLNFQHPAFGLMKIVGDAFALPNFMDIYQMGSWRRMFYGNNQGLRTLPGPIAGAWNRLPSSVAGNGYSLSYSMDTYTDFVDVCLDAPRNVRISNVTY